MRPTDSVAISSRLPVDPEPAGPTRGALDAPQQRSCQKPPTAGASRRRPPYPVDSPQYKAYIPVGHLLEPTGWLREGHPGVPRAAGGNGVRVPGRHRRRALTPDRNHRMVDLVDPVGVRQKRQEAAVGDQQKAPRSGAAALPRCPAEPLPEESESDGPPHRTRKEWAWTTARAMSCRARSTFSC